MKKILMLNGSPRGSASASLTMALAFAEGYTEACEAEVERIDLADKDISPCTGCFGCWKSGRGECVIKDDMASILPSYAAADLVLVSTPVYHFGMTAILKAFFERSLPLLYPYMVKKGDLYSHPERTKIREGQAFGVFATCGFPDEDNFRAMRTHFEKLLGSSLRFQFYCPEGELLKVPQMRDAAAPRIAALKSAGAAFAKTLSLPAGAEAAVSAPMVDAATFARLANANWSVPGEKAPSEAAFAGLEPYDPAAGEAGGAGLEPGKPSSPAFSFLRQMGAIFNPKGAVGLEAVLQFDFSDIGESYQFEIADGKCELRAGSALAATTKIVVPFSTWKRISDGELSGEEALMKGAYRVEGDFKLMMRMNEIFGRSQAEDAAPKAKKKPNLMALAFVPWYFGWFLGGTSFLLGQAAPFVVSLAFLAYRERHHEATWFERGTPLAFAFLSMLSLAAPEAFASRWNGLANAAIALVWASSLVYGRPLTADYSKGDYSASVASGSIFSRVNVLLTAVWCVLFGLCAAAGLFLTGMSQGRLSIGSAILLIPAGIFTAWFPRWYPGHLARRGSQKSPSA